VILSSSGLKPQGIGTLRENLLAPRFRYYHSGAALSITSSVTPTAGYSLDNLQSEVYKENVLWSTPAVTLTAEFSAQMIDTIILGNPGMNKVRVQVYNGSALVMDSIRLPWVTYGRVWIVSNGNYGLVFERGGDGKVNIEKKLAPGETDIDPTDQGIVFFHFAHKTATKVVLTFSEGAGSLNKLWIGKERSMIAGSGAEYPLEIRGSGGRTDVGTVYGMRLPSFRGFKYTWENIDDAQRREFERYLDAVGLVTPHYIMPFDEDREFVPPMFAVVTNTKLDNKRKSAGWWWDGITLEYEVVR